MAESVTIIARESKTLQQGLKELLITKSKDPWDREVEFQRKNLQRQYLLLLLTHPYAKDSKDIQTHLWMQTSYALISVYKNRISALERTLREPPRQTHHGRNQPRHNHGPVEHRKLLQRFKQFLSQEEKFWSQLIVRLQRQFRLTEARSSLIALGILSASENPDPPGDTPAESTGGRPSHFRFPPEPEDEQPHPTPVQHAFMLTTLSKALICLGDIARYRELHNESTARPRPGNDGAQANRGGRNRRGSAISSGTETSSQVRTYDRARACYERARDLVPDEGNASHQLAILASYQRDTFESLLHYYRALCIRTSYDPAVENMGNVLTKFLEGWKKNHRKDKLAEEAAEGSIAVRLKTRMFKDDLIALHALWRLGTEEMDRLAPQHASHTISAFADLVAGRNLPIDTITKVFILAQGALWNHRTVRRSGGHGRRTSTSPTPPSVGLAVEYRILDHVLALHRILLEQGIAELDESTNIAEAENELAMRLTATFRRTLPALRIAGKWLRANVDYLSSLDGETSLDIAQNLANFWETYFRFSRSISTAFPPDVLPPMRLALEEDVELRGFLPLTGMLFERAVVHDGAVVDAGPATEQVHPNEEQLMRIRDIWDDTKALAEIRCSSIQSSSQAMTLNRPSTPDEVGDHPYDTHNRYKQCAEVVTKAPSNSTGSSDFDEDARTETTDPVGDAFRQVLNVQEDDEDDDEIVWDPRASEPFPTDGVTNDVSTPHFNAHARMSPISPITPSSKLSPPHTANGGIAPAHRQSTSPPSVAPRGMTAQDLLNNVMGMGRPSAPPVRNPPQSLRLPAQVTHSPHVVSSTSPSLLFGSASPGGFASGQQSIWSTAPDEGPLRYHQRQPSGSFPLSSPPSTTMYSNQPPSQGPWPSRHSTHLSQTLPMNAISTPSTSYGPLSSQQQVLNHHRRIPSASAPMQAYDNAGYSQYGPGPQAHVPSSQYTPSASASSLYPDMLAGLSMPQQFAGTHPDSLPVSDLVSHHRPGPFESVNMSPYSQMHQPAGSIWSG